MKSRLLKTISAMSLLAVLALSIRSAAQQSSSTSIRYTVTDLGTLQGGTFSAPFAVNQYNLVSGVASLPDNSLRAVLWLDGMKADIGKRGLGGPDSTAFAANVMGQVVGEAETPNSDSNGEDFCGFGTHLVCLPFLWELGRMHALPTLGGSNGGANQINSFGVAAGFAENATPDPGCPAPQVLQFKPVIWAQGRIHELPTAKGDPDGLALGINDNGQIVGASGTCTTFNPNTLINLLAVHALLWQNGTVTDLGNLGGTTGEAGGNLAWAINNKGEAIGVSDLPGDTTFHGFLWTKATGMQDLGTLDDDFASTASGLNDNGDVVGLSLGNNGPTAWLHRRGQHGLTNLNQLVAGTSPLYLMAACGITSHGEITGLGATSTGELHAYLATPVSTNALSSTTAPATASHLALAPEALARLRQQARTLGRFGIPLRAQP
jgi:probable HAF family extracellular repeat protein